jgi:Complex 1 protein (LYR family)
MRRAGAFRCIRWPQSQRFVLIDTVSTCALRSLSSFTPGPSNGVPQDPSLPRQGGGGRRRHRFGESTDQIPSFRDFQLKMQIWSLYRQFTRLVFRSTSDKQSRNELQSKIRHEFRLAQSDHWHIQRALSEGSRRYKELSAMLGNSVKHVNNTTSIPTASPAPLVDESPAPPVATTSAWPWNQPTSDDVASPTRRLLVFPRKSDT